MSYHLLRTTWPEVEIDLGKPLGPNLRSIARIGGGYFKYETSSLPMPLLGDFLFTITGGSIERDEHGKLTAFITTRSPVVSAQRLAERLAIDRMDLVSEDEKVSTDPSRLSTFTSESTFAIPAGEVILGQRIPQTISYTTRTVVSGYLDGLTFKGSFDAFFGSNVGSMPVRGSFEVHVV